MLNITWILVILQVDFDRWKSPDDEDENEVAPDVMKDWPGLYDDLQKDEYGYKIENMRIVYLFLYNFFQFVGYLYIVGVLSIRYMKNGPGRTLRNIRNDFGNCF